ncbi:MAG: DNA gyrase inhibitor YacG [Nitrospirae bacterium]|nr:DNA gyrase inhibitor YacG [Nitrospirota bacterium]
MFPCPICRKETRRAGNPFRPFCSRRCQIMDLAAWTSGSYSVPEDAHSSDSFSQEERN